MTWFAKTAAMARNMYVVGPDWRTAWQRARGATCKIWMVDFGEVARYKCRSHEGTIGNSEFRWGIGVWLGVDSRTGQNILFDDSQGGFQHSRTLMRMPDAQKFDIDRISSVTATPWSIHEMTQPEGVFAEKETNQDQDQAALPPK